MKYRTVVTPLSGLICLQGTKHGTRILRLILQQTPQNRHLPTSIAMLRRSLYIRTGLMQLTLVSLRTLLRYKALLVEPLTLSLVTA